MAPGRTRPAGGSLATETERPPGGPLILRALPRAAVQVFCSRPEAADNTTGEMTSSHSRWSRWARQDERVLSVADDGNQRVAARRLGMDRGTQNRETHAVRDPRRPPPAPSRAICPTGPQEPADLPFRAAENTSDSCDPNLRRGQAPGAPRACGTLAVSTGMSDRTVEPRDATAGEFRASRSWRAGLILPERLAESLAESRSRAARATTGHRVDQGSRPVYRSLSFNLA